METELLLVVLQIGLSSYLELFRRAPESLSVFPLLRHLSQEDLEFYSQLKNHSIRVTGVLSMLIRQVRARILFERDNDNLVFTQFALVT
jgi:hypothetical protein